MDRGWEFAISSRGRGWEFAISSDGSFKHICFRHIRHILTFQTLEALACGLLFGLDVLVKVFLKTIYPQPIAGLLLAVWLDTGPEFYQVLPPPCLVTLRSF